MRSKMTFEWAEWIECATELARFQILNSEVVLKLHFLKWYTAVAHMNAIVMDFNYSMIFINLKHFHDQRDRECDRRWLNKTQVSCNVLNCIKMVWI